MRFYANSWCIFNGTRFMYWMCYWCKCAVQCNGDWIWHWILMQKCNDEPHDSTAWAAHIAIALLARLDHTCCMCCIHRHRLRKVLSRTCRLQIFTWYCIQRFPYIYIHFSVLFKAYLYFSPAPCCIYKRPGKPINQSVLQLMSLSPSRPSSLPPSMAAERSS
jgi:hypothetical protein